LYQAVFYGEYLAARQPSKPKITPCGLFAAAYS